MFFCLSWSTMYSEVLQERARMVQVGFLSAWDTKEPASTTKRFLQSCAWQLELSTDDLGSSPILVVPTSWMIRPGACSPYWDSGPGLEPSRIAPALVRISSKVSCMCLACLSS